MTEINPVQAAFLMRHLSRDDRDRMIREAGDVVLDWRERFLALQRMRCKE